MKKMLEFERVMSAIGIRSGSKRRSQPSKAHSEVAGEDIESFYLALSDGLLELESALSTDSMVSFRVEWLVLGISFLHSIHLATFALVETFWLPRKSSLGADSLIDYLDVSMSLLDMCNDLKQGFVHLEIYEMSLELALKRLLLAASQNLEPQGRPTPDSSTFLKPLDECKRELDRLDTPSAATAFSWNLAMEFGPACVVCNASSSSYSFHPSADPGKKSKKGRDVSVVLHDVHVVSRFVSCILLGTITGRLQRAGADEIEGGRESFAIDHVEAELPPCSMENRSGSKSKSKSSRVPAAGMSWSTFRIMFRLKDKVERSFKGMQKSSSCSSFMKLHDVKHLQSSLKVLRGEMEGGLKDGKLVPGTDFSEKIRGLLEQKKEKLDHLSKNLGCISSQLNDMFDEIVEKRKKVLDAFDRDVQLRPASDALD